MDRVGPLHAVYEELPVDEHTDDCARPRCDAGHDGLSLVASALEARVAAAHAAFAEEEARLETKAAARVAASRLVSTLCAQSTSSLHNVACISVSSRFASDEWRVSAVLQLSADSELLSNARLVLVCADSSPLPAGRCTVADRVVAGSAFVLHAAVAMHHLYTQSHWVYLVAEAAGDTVVQPLCVVQPDWSGLAVEAADARCGAASAAAALAARASFLVTASATDLRGLPRGLGDALNLVPQLEERRGDRAACVVLRPTIHHPGLPSSSRVHLHEAAEPGVAWVSLEADTDEGLRCLHCALAAALPADVELWGDECSDGVLDQLQVAASCIRSEAQLVEAGQSAHAAQQAETDTAVALALRGGW